MLEDGKIFIGKSSKPEYLYLPLANRHGLITGATGTGKTVRCRCWPRASPPPACRCSAADVKGDLSGIAAPGARKPTASSARAEQIGIDRLRRPRLPGRLLGPVRRAGPSGPRHRHRDGPAAAGRACWSSTTRRKACSTSPSSSPTSRACCCSTSRTCARCCSRSPRTRSELTTTYGNVSKATIGTIQRALLVLEQQGGELLRRAGARPQGPDAHATATGAAPSTSWRPTS